MIEMLISNDMIDEMSMNSISFSTLMNPKDLKNIMSNHNSFLAEIKKHQDAYEKQKLDFEQMQI